MLPGRFSKLIKQTPTSLAHGRRQLILDGVARKACVPNVCQVRKTRPSSIGLNHGQKFGNLLIQKVVGE